MNRKPKRVNLKNRPTQCGDTSDEQESARILYLVLGTSSEAVMKDFVRSTYWSH